MRSDFSCTKLSMVLVCLAAGVQLAPDALAQQPDSSTTYTEYNSGTPEEVTVTPPRHAPARSTIGAPIQDVSISVPISYSDLNLHTGEGVYTLRQRVKYTAKSLCDRLSFRYPIGVPDSDTCYRRAVRMTTPQADSAIWNYRSPSSM